MYSPMATQPVTRAGGAFGQINGERALFAQIINAPDQTISVRDNFPPEKPSAEPIPQPEKPAPSPGESDQPKPNPAKPQN